MVMYPYLHDTLGGCAGDAWLEVAQVSSKLWNSLSKDHLTAQSILTIRLCLQGYQSGNDPWSLMVTLQVIPMRSGDSVIMEDEEDTNDNDTIFVHPILFCFLSQYAISSDDCSVDETSKMDIIRNIFVSPVPLVEYQYILSAFYNDLIQISECAAPSLERQQNSLWSIQTVPVVEIDENAIKGDDYNIHLSCIYSERDTTDQNTVSTNQLDEEVQAALQARILQEGCIILFQTLCFGYVIAKVVSIVNNNISNEATASLPSTKKTCCNAYRFMGNNTCKYRMDSPLANPSHTVDEIHRPRNHNEILIDTSDTTVPGYESLLTEILQTLQIPPSHPSAVTGMLLTGSSGVGKTRMAHCIAHRLLQHHRQQEDDDNKNNSNNEPFYVYYLSVQDLIFRASNESHSLLETELLPNLSRNDGPTLWILDDLQLLESPDDGEDEYLLHRNIELVIVKNAIVEAIDAVHNQCRILGIAQQERNLPKDLAKIGRLEKTVHMHPPTQSQRFQILKSILLEEHNSHSEATIEKWSEALTPLTPGCVARDLHRAYQDAVARSLARNREDERKVYDLNWEDLLYSARTLVPSELEELDVIKPIALDLGLTDQEIHYQSFKALGGYATMKKHLYRHVVSPWKHFFASVDAPQDEIRVGLKSWLEPPPGVLFYGESGTGKTQAAICLANSLMLPIIQVRAADVLDRWLGGSESILRSLFAKARSASPCILFLDEIDSLAGNREDDESNEFSSRILSTLLNEIDGVSSSVEASQVLVIACTNRIQSLDAALLRPGRLQEHIFVDLPTVQDVEDMLQIRLEVIPLESSFDFHKLAEDIVKRKATGADVEGLCREACMVAMRRFNTLDELKVTGHDFGSAMRELFPTNR